MTDVLLEDSWLQDNEADDIIKYANDHEYRLSILSYDDLYKNGFKVFFIMYLFLRY